MPKLVCAPQTAHSNGYPSAPRGRFEFPKLQPKRMDAMSSYLQQLRARITQKRCRLEKIESANLLPIGNSRNAAALAAQELRRQIAVDEGVLADYVRR